MSSGIQGLLQGLLTGAMSGLRPGGSFWDGFKSGFAGGFLGGTAGFAANSAFAASASGLWGTLAAGAVVGGADGGVSAFASSFSSTGDLASAFADAAFGSAVGAATGGLISLGSRELAALRALNGPAAGFKTGDEARDFLHGIVGGRKEVSIKLGPGLGRFVDVLSGQTAHEVKMGFKAYSQALLTQIRKDAAIRDAGAEGVRNIHWHFFKSANTGKVGADPRLLAELEKNNIRYTIHD